MSRHRPMSLFLSTALAGLVLSLAGNGAAAPREPAGAPAASAHAGPAAGVHAPAISPPWAGPLVPVTPLTPASIRAEVQQILEGVSPEVMRDNLTRLVGFETRHTLSATDDPVRGIGAARQHILETLRGYGGRLQVDFDTYQVKASGRRLSRDFELRNVIATLPGSNPPARQRILLVSGHYDTLAFSRRPEGGFNFDPNTYAPGADDDGSGTAVVMELARLMADYPTEATVMFVTVAGEELGLIGSSLLAQRLAREGANVEAMITNDIVGSPEGGDGQIDGTRVRVFSAGPADSGSRAWARYIRRVAGAYLPSIHIDTIFRYDRFGRGGDHTPFVQEGYRGVRITESHEFYARQHTTEDELEYVDFDYMANVARVNAAALATLANAPAPPRVNDEERGRPMLSRGDSRYDARLRWLPNEEEDLAGYVVWMRRTTSPFWERSWRAGNVTEFILTDVSIDDWTFGIQAVDTDGNESLISAYVYPLRERRVIETVSR